MTFRVLIAVTHLLGAGHLTRAAALARAFARRGHETVLVSGGMPASLVALDGLRLVQLPPVRTTGTDFKALLDERGIAIDPARLAARRRQLLDTLDKVRPDVVISELFPFGRRVLAAEFMALVEAARAMRPRPLIACSVRDILVAPVKAGRIEEAHERLASLYDLVLVHGDPELVPLEASRPLDKRVRPLLRYTGYVDEGGEVPAAGKRAGILVSGGSSAASIPLYEAAFEAAGMLRSEPWRILVGNGVPEDRFAALKGAAPENVTIERARRDFRALLRQAAVSVSQAGYNTAVDLLRTETSAVLVPFEAGNETEQRLRAERLQAHGVARVVPEAELSGTRLAQAVRATLEAADTRPALSVDLDGAAHSVRIVESMIRSINIHSHNIDWDPLDEALRRARASGREPVFWWRDDDAVAKTTQLRRLLDLSCGHASPVALAIIPQGVEPSLAAALAEEPGAAALVHGFAHVNHAPAAAKKAEFGADRPLGVRENEAAAGLRLLVSQLGPRLLPVFVPPWNRMAPDLLPGLVRSGYHGVSTFGRRRSTEPAPGLLQVNTHIDPIDWHGARSLADPGRLVAMAADAVALDEPVGLLTHHLVHDEAVWRFCEAFLDRLHHNNIQLTLAASLFSVKNRIVPEP